jgi:hypothetical protein
MKIVIYSSWTNPGGSTTAMILLTNALNEAGYETIFCGPHTWHLDKCKSEQTNSKLKLNPEDTLIAHFTDKIKFRPPIKNVILSCHEQNIFPLKNINYKVFDKIHFVSEHQRQYHNIDHPSFIIPNILDDLKANPKPTKKVAGIIGSIDKNKNVHISIQRALNDNCDEVLIFGNITDPVYYETQVKSLIDGKKVKYVGYMNDKQKMYDMISHLYISSEMECLPYVIGECKLTNTIVCGIEGKNYLNSHYEFDNNRIVQKWLQEINTCSHKAY